jgi:hypothetical protein
MGLGSVSSSPDNWGVYLSSEERRIWFAPHL